MCTELLMPPALHFQHVSLHLVQAKTQAVEQQLANTTSELQNLKARQLQLELLLQNADIGNDHSTLSAQNQVI